jgi:hypothetical protein
MSLPASALEEMDEELGLFSAVAESAFVRRGDGVVLFYPWGSSGRGYAMRSEREHRRLRRELAWILRIALLGLPLAVTFFPDEVVPRALPVALLLALVLLLRIFWLTRRLPPCAERISKHEAGARLAAALSRRRIGRVTRFYLVLAAASFVLFFAGWGAPALIAGILAALGAAVIRAILGSIRDRHVPRSR